MKRLLLLLALVLLGFYLFWPAWSLYQVRESIRRDDADALARKVDFPSVRASLRPVLTVEAQKVLERVRDSAGGFGSLLKQVQGDLVPRIVDTALDVVVTPENVLHIARNREALRDALRRVMIESAGVGKLGLAPQRKDGERALTTNGGSTARPASKTSRSDALLVPRYTYANVKSISVTGPLAFDLGVNRRAEENRAELTVNMAFTGADWKIVGLVPHF